MKVYVWLRLVWLGDTSTQRLAISPAAIFIRKAFCEISAIDSIWNRVNRLQRFCSRLHFSVCLQTGATGLIELFWGGEIMNFERRPVCPGIRNAGIRAAFRSGGLNSLSGLPSGSLSGSLIHSMIHVMRIPVRLRSLGDRACSTAIVCGGVQLAEKLRCAVLLPYHPARLS